MKTLPYSVYFKLTRDLDDIISFSLYYVNSQDYQVSLDIYYTLKNSIDIA
jgi:hypothetical protein